mgnify:CR=1 FL=1
MTSLKVPFIAFKSAIFHISFVTLNRLERSPPLSPISYLHLHFTSYVFITSVSVLLKGLQTLPLFHLQLELQQ